MNPTESLRQKRDALAKKEERLRSQLSVVCAEIADIDTAMRVWEKYIVEEVGKRIRAEAEAAPSEEQPTDATSEDEAEDAQEDAGEREAETGANDAFRLTPPAEGSSMTRKQRVFAATPVGRKSAVGPKDLTDLVNQRFGTRYTPNHVRPLVWKLAKEDGTVETENGLYWRPESEGPGERPGPNDDGHVAERSNAADS